MSNYFLSAASCVFALALGCSAQTPPPVPPEYQDIYSNVSSGLNNFSSTIHSNWDGSPYPVMYSAQLLSAGSDLTTGLLAPNYYQYSVISELNDLQALGVTAITFHVNFPALLPSYYGDPTEYQAYLSFYQQLVAEIRGRGLKIIIENTTPTVYPGNNGVSYGPYLQTLDWNTYQSLRAQLAANIAQTLQPDYLVLVAEPDTEANNTGQTTENTVSGCTSLVQGMINAVRAAGVSPTTVKLGAGSGSWNPNFLQFEQNFASMPLQFVDMHIYPVNRGYLPNALSAAQAIQAAGKEVTMSEFWLYKVADSELGVLDYTTIYSRDPFSFWQPLDAEMLQVVSDFANYQHFSFITPFWSHYFSAYLDYGAYGSMAPSDVISAAGKAAGNAVNIGAYTPTGNYWENLIIPAADLVPPSAPAPAALKSVSQTIANLTWNPTTDNQGVAAYNLYRDGALIATINGMMGYSDQSLQASSTYTYTVNAFDASGNISAMSGPLVVTTLKTPDKTAPTVPTGLSLNAFTDTQMYLSWMPSSDNFGVTGYEIYRGSSPSTLAPWATTPSPAYLDTKGAPATTYYYAVDAYDAFNNHSAKSTAVKGTMPSDTTPPTTPSGVTALSGSGPSVTVTWNASTDDWAVGSYKILRGSSPTSLVQIGGVAPTALSFVDTKALSGKTYYYAVTAVDLFKNTSPQSAPVTVTVP